MNKQETLEILSTVNDQVSPQLRTMVYIDWFGWLIFILVLMGLVILAWVKKDKLNKISPDEIPAGSFFAWGLTGFMALFLFPFIPYTIQVFTIPEVVALRSLLGS
tara:strand:+ start:345 stop:659 length:315 start_codon:yes stop_codon:yes gene_type:complete